MSDPTPLSNASQNLSDSHWVFGYGSLIWRPGFEYLSAALARAHGVHRALCIYSFHYRGTETQPGLVFGLMRGGSCAGMAYEISAENWPAARDYLRERELVTHVYREVYRNLRLADGRSVTAMTFVVDEAHEQFAGRLSVADQLEMVTHANGSTGSNRDYVLNTVDHLNEMGFADKHLIDLSRRLKDQAALRRTS